MTIQLRLTAMNFMQFFVWGSWLISLGAYMIVTLGFSGGQVGSIYATMGVASLFMPGLMGIVADRWVNAERVFGFCHLVGAGLRLWASTVKDYDTLYVIMLLNAMVYMPTIALNNTVSYKVLQQKGFNVIRSFPPIRVWGTVGFIAAMWMVDFAGWTKSALQLYISAGAAVFLGIYGFTMPKCPPARDIASRSLAAALGLDAFVLFKRPQMLVFFVFAMMLGAALQITNAFGGAYLDDFKTAYPGTFGVEHPNLLLSISQISETLFILTIPFFLQRFGIKKVMLISIFAWVFR
ncbi:MAG: MFS transporter, partial [Terriglobales bacterium]